MPDHSHQSAGDSPPSMYGTDAPLDRALGLLRDELTGGAVADSSLARVTDGLVRRVNRLSETTQALATVIAALVGATLLVASVLLIAAAVVGSPVPMAEGPSDAPSSTSAPQQGSLSDTVQGLSADTGDW